MSTDSVLQRANVVLTLLKISPGEMGTVLIYSNQIQGVERGFFDGNFSVGSDSTFKDTLYRQIFVQSRPVQARAVTDEFHLSELFGIGVPQATIFMRGESNLSIVRKHQTDHIWPSIQTRVVLVANSGMVYFMPFLQYNFFMQ